MNHHKKILSVLVCVVLFATLTITPATALNYDSNQNKVLNAVQIKELETQIHALNKEFPDANLSVSRAISHTNEMLSLNRDARSQYIRTLFSNEPQEEYTVIDGNEVKTLKVYAAGAYEVAGRTLGSSTSSGTTTTYQNTQVYVRYIIGVSGFEMSYKVNHIHSPSGSTVTSTHSVASTFGQNNIANYRVSGKTIVNGTGAQAVVTGDVDLWDATGSTWAYLYTLTLTFSASTLQASVSSY